MSDIFEEFQNTNPERGRKQFKREHYPHFHIEISEHEPRKGTETSGGIFDVNMVASHFRTRISKEDGTGYDFLLMKSQPVVYVLSLQCILLMLNWQKRG